MKALRNKAIPILLAVLLCALPLCEAAASSAVPAESAEALRQTLRGLLGLGDCAPEVEAGGGAGDLVARIVFEVPQYLTGRQRGLLEDLAKTLDASNFPESRSFAEKVKTFYSHKDKLTKK